jgi:hypothetical protein
VLFWEFFFIVKKIYFQTLHPMKEKSMAEAVADTLRCGLTGQVMKDPVVVSTDINPNLVYGQSYERAELKQWLAEQGDNETRFRPNPALKAVIVWYNNLKTV